MKAVANSGTNALVSHTWRGHTRSVAESADEIPLRHHTPKMQLANEMAKGTIYITREFQYRIEDGLHF